VDGRRREERRGRREEGGKEREERRSRTHLVCDGLDGVCQGIAAEVVVGGVCGCG
jgi:hypothetical protein